MRAFLSSPFDPNPLFDPQKPSPLISRWAHPFELTFRDSATVQRELLAQSLLVTAGESSVLEELTQYFRRLPDFLSVLAQSRNPRVPTPDIQNEYDLQVLVHAMLRLIYDDVRAEDPVPQHAGGSSRVDFLLRESGVVIETKMTRSGLSDAKLGTELLVDWGRYPRHPDCRAIFAVVYDPNRHVKNPAGLEHDLSGGMEGLTTRAIVVR